MLSKSQLIQAIMDMNPSAQRRWLASFDETALRRYLAHLRHADRPRSHRRPWIREPETTAVVRRRSAA